MNPNDVATAYIALWNETDGARRAVMLKNGWAAGATYIDPMMKADRSDAVNDLIAATHQRFPDHRFTLKGAPDGHNHYARFSWTLAKDEADPIAIGTDVVSLDSDGRVASVIGFLDFVAAGV